MMWVRAEINGEFTWIHKQNKLFRRWAKEVKRRDNHVCQICGRGREHIKRFTVHAHHIIPLEEDGTRALDVNNGITLCEKCHRDVHRRKT